MDSKKLLKEWIIPFGLLLILYFTGLYKPVVAFAQRMVLSTGIIKPDTKISETESLEVISYDWTLQTLDGQPVSFSEFKDKVIFLNLFATWCPPCIAEMPGIQSLYEDLNNDSVVFVILSRDDNREIARKFMEKKGYSLPVYMAAGPTPSEFYSNVLPTTYIISRQGKIVSTHAGMADYDNTEVKDFLKKLADEAI